MLESNVYELQSQKPNDKKVIRFHLGVVFFAPPCITKNPNLTLIWPLIDPDGHFEFQSIFIRIMENPTQ